MTSRPPHAKPRRTLASGHLAIVDDAGTEQRIKLWDMLADGDERTRFVLSLAMRVMKSPSPRLPFLCIMLAGILTMVVSNALGSTAIGAMIGTTALACASIFLCVLTTLSLFHLARQRRFRRQGREFSGVFLANGICPVCVYPVCGIPADDEGLVRCAECGAAWEASRVVQEPVRATAGAPSASVFGGLGINNQIAWNERQISDMRGTRHALLDKQFHKAIRLAGEPEHRARLVEARAALRASAPLRRVLGCGMSGLIAAILLLYMQYALRMNWPPATLGQGFRMLVPFLLVFNFYFVFVMLANVHGHSANKPTTIREMVKRNLCPACGEDLGPVAPAEDGTRVCPRCLACWK